MGGRRRHFAARPSGPMPGCGVGAGERRCPGAPVGRALARSPPCWTPGFGTNVVPRRPGRRTWTWPSRGPVPPPAGIRAAWGGMGGRRRHFAARPSGPMPGCGVGAGSGGVPALPWAGPWHGHRPAGRPGSEPTSCRAGLAGGPGPGRRGAPFRRLRAFVQLGAAWVGARGSRDRTGFVTTATSTAPGGPRSGPRHRPAAWPRRVWDAGCSGSPFRPAVGACRVLGVERPGWPRSPGRRPAVSVTVGPSSARPSGPPCAGHRNARALCRSPGRRQAAPRRGQQKAGPP